MTRKSTKPNNSWQHLANLHPVIRPACFFLLVAGLSATSKLFIFIVPLFLIPFRNYYTFLAILPLLKHLRWLFLSLLVLNLWFSSTFTWLPNIAGLLLALKQIIILILIVLLAHLLITTTSTQEIIAALRWWFTPLNKIGFSSEKLAVRLALVLDTVQAAQNLYTEVSSTPTFDQKPIKNLGEKAAILFTQVFKQAEMVPLRTLEIPELQPPPIKQWIYPLFILILILSFEL